MKSMGEQTFMLEVHLLGAPCTPCQAPEHIESDDNLAILLHMTRSNPRCFL